MDCGGSVKVHNVSNMDTRGEHYLKTETPAESNWSKFRRRVHSSVIPVILAFCHDGDFLICCIDLGLVSHDEKLHKASRP